MRLPTLEVFSALHGDALSFGGTPLTPEERRIAFEIFRSSIDLDPVRVVEAPIANAPTTLGNFIRVRPGEPISRRTLIHELTHVWQFQTKGTEYISDSALHQAWAAITAGSRDAAYDVTIVPGQSIHDYQAEHQAMIVEGYYSDPAKRADSEYERMIEEVRRARPIPYSLILEEAAFGPGSRTRDALPPRFDDDRDRPMVPLIRLEF